MHMSLDMYTCRSQQGVAAELFSDLVLNPFH